MNQMKAEIFYFNTALEKRCEYKHQQEIFAWQAWEVAKKIFDTGLNVMISHSSHSGEEKIMIYVDDKKFKQR